MDILIGFPEGQALAGNLAARTGLALHQVALHRFPDGESLVRLEAAPERAVIVRSLDQPNDKLVELQFLAGALRERGCRELTLVAPYLAYMRQDMEFRPGEVVSQRIMGRWLGGLFDRIITVDPHLHRTHDLGEVFPGGRSAALTAGPLLGAWARAQGSAEQGWVVLGPDEESDHLVNGAAEAAGVRGIVGLKVRRGDHDVSVGLPQGTDLSGRTVLFVDDIVSSGGTLIDAAKVAYAHGASRVLAATVHAVFPLERMAAFTAAGIDTVVSADGIPHPTNAIGLSDLIADCLSVL
ncbi:ribose-phosphate diphosphokinase [Niveispirillum sp.]|uniref:ribose-phosphate diphosphokinase n=1 Tax=Niveispirillum sp. TaxID=1917217 RepID=UPI001B41AD1F|nr:ribose-phosphate diphosphokinase [Niveispirillum sp.]MBP7339520.1 ribose-phosphate diphosphokinase [Niveispirillum sp.]